MSVRSLEPVLEMFESKPEELVSADHDYRKILKIIDFKKLTHGLVESCYSRYGKAGYHPSQGFKMLLVQYIHDLSDRELESHLKDSISAKYFCGFGIMESTPDHSYFGKFRERIGTKRTVELFNKFRDALKRSGEIKEIFTFVDSTKLEAKVDSWKARDKAIADRENNETDDDGNPTMNNKNVHEYSNDPDARYGAKGKNKIWLGYKRHVSVDMSQGFINKAAVTAANVHDGIGLKHIRPNQGAVVGDKAYSEGEADKTIKSRGLHSLAIKKNNRKSKNMDKDRFISKLRMPFEGVFSQQSKKARFIGKRKLQFQVTMDAFVFNLKRALVVGLEKVPITP